MEKVQLKTITCRLPFEVWKFVKIAATMQDVKAKDIIIDSLREYKKTCDSKLNTKN